jgi:hypothetical protein
MPAEQLIDQLIGLIVALVGAACACWHKAAGKSAVESQAKALRRLALSLVKLTSGYFKVRILYSASCSQ